MFSAPSAFCSPTTAQIFEVPISRPTMMFESSNIFPPGVCRVVLILASCPARALAAIQRTGTLLATARSTEAIVLFMLLSQIVNFAASARNCWSKFSRPKVISLPCPVVATTTPGDGNIHAPQIHQPRHRRMVERADQLQRRLRLRRFDAMARLQLINIQARDHRQLRAHLRQRNHAQARVQRLHHKAVLSS